MSLVPFQLETIEEKNSSSKNAEIEEIPDDWNPMAEDATSLANTYAFDPSDAGSLIQGYKGKDLTGICKHFIRGYCKFGLNCGDKHLTPSQIEALDSEEVLIDPFETDLVQEGMDLDVTVSCCASPYSFYVTPAQDLIWPKTYESRVGQNFDFTDPTIENYQILIRDLAKFYSKPENQENLFIFPALGGLLAVKGGQGFYRARMIDAIEEEKLLVMNIDTGAEETVNRRQVYTLKPKFATLPAFAIHCAIDMPPGFCVRDKVAKNFSNMVLNKRFKAQFLEKNMEGRFTIRLLHSDGQKVDIVHDNLR